MLFALGQQPPPPPPPSIGFVLSREGPWQWDGRDLKPGQGLPSGARLLLKPGTTMREGEVFSINVVLLNNRALPFQCVRIEQCRAGLTLPSSFTKEATLSEKLKGVFDLISDRVERYVGLMSRGAPREACLPDGVAKLQANRVMLSSFFGRLAPGRYRLQFTLVDAGAGAAPSAIDLAWDKTDASASPSVTMSPALYRVTLSRPGDAAFEPCEAWLLVSDERRFAAAKASFDDAAAATRAWDPAVPPRDIALFLHAYLGDLARQRE
jgi:hypothetical protein